MDIKDRVRLALAIVCIRTKPPDVSGQDYAQFLCDRYKASVVQFKKRLDSAETEILHLRQQLFMKENRKLCIDVTDLTENSQPLFPTPPSSGNVIISNVPDVTLAKHTTFLQHVTNLQTASSKMSPDIATLTVESVLSTLDVLPSFIGLEVHSCTLQQECVKCIINIFNKISENHQSKIITKITSLCEHLANLIASSGLHEPKVLEAWMQSLIDLGCRCNISYTVLDILCSSLNHGLQQLQLFIEQRENLDPACYDSLFYILTTMDKLLLKSSSTLNKNQKNKIKHYLEEALLHVNEYFPLVSHYMLKISAKIK